jgi:hypothetical protein
MQLNSFIILFFFICIAESTFLERFQKTTNYIDLEKINNKYAYSIRTDLQFLKQKINESSFINNKNVPLPVEFLTSKTFPKQWPQNQSEDDIALGQVILEYYRYYSKIFKSSHTIVNNQEEARVIETRLNYFLAKQKSHSDFSFYFRKLLYTLTLNNRGYCDESKNENVNYFEWKLENDSRKYTKFLEVIMVYTAFNYKLADHLNELKMSDLSIFPFEYIKISYKILNALKFVKDSKLKPKKILSLNSFGLIKKSDPYMGNDIMIVTSPDNIKSYDLKFLNTQLFETEDRKDNEDLYSVNIAIELLDHVGMVFGNKSIKQFIHDFISTALSLDLKNYTTYEIESITSIFRSYSTEIDSIFQFLKSPEKVMNLVKAFNKKTIFFQVFSNTLNADDLLMQLIIFMNLKQTRTNAIHFFKQMIFRIYIDKMNPMFISKFRNKVENYFLDTKIFLSDYYPENKIEHIKQVYLMALVNEINIVIYIKAFKVMLEAIANLDLASFYLYNAAVSDSENLLANYSRLIMTKMLEMKKVGSTDFITKIKVSNSLRSLDDVYFYNKDLLQTLI